jgi:quinol monooxygenase YgiN
MGRRAAVEGNMSKAVTVVVRVNARADRLSETAALLRELAQQSRKEAGCRSYRVLQETARPAEFLLLEEWSDEAALQAHRQTPHVAAAFAQAPTLLETEPQSGTYLAVA